ncbi:hypothetical protein Tco_1459941, partial [Tanacetum coccineum]
METIHVKFDELTDMASACDNLEPRMNCMNFQDSLEDSQSISSKSDLDNLFGPLYEEYYATSSQEVLDNSAANTLDNTHTSPSSSIVVEEDRTPQIVSSLAEQVVTEPNSLGLFFILVVAVILCDMSKESESVLGEKIKNIDGKGMRAGNLRSVLRGMPLNQPGSFVTFKDGTVRPVEDQQSRPSVAMDKNPSSSGFGSCSDEIFGGVPSQHGTIGKNGSSFASITQVKNNKRVVKIKELRNEVAVEGAAVAIPLRACRRGKSTYARALIEVSAEKELLDSLVIAIPVDKEDNGHTLATIDIEYEWNPSRCETCLVFDHHSDKCPKLPKADPIVNVDEDGFIEVKKKKHKNKNKQNKFVGVRLTKPQPQL